MMCECDTCHLSVAPPPPFIYVRSNGDLGPYIALKIMVRHDSFLSTKKKKEPIGFIFNTPPMAQQINCEVEVPTRPRLAASYCSHLDKIEIKVYNYCTFTLHHFIHCTVVQS